jgi:RNA polymerase sigma factor (sigma-70 family)
VSDEHLLEAIGRDPHAGIRDVMTLYGPRLLGRAQRYAHDLDQAKEDAEDVTQDAVLRLLDPIRRAEVMAAGGQLLPWLSKWCRWRLLDLAKRRERELGHMPRQLDTVDTSEPSAAAETVGAVFDELTPRDRLILTWRYETNMTNAEVGEKLGISEGAAKKAAHDARERLRKLLAQRGVTFDDEVNQ